MKTLFRLVIYSLLIVLVPVTLKWRPFTKESLVEDLSKLPVPKQCTEHAEKGTGNLLVMSYMEYQDQGFKLLVYCREFNKKVIKTNIRLNETIYPVEILLEGFVLKQRTDNEIFTYLKGRFELQENVLDVQFDFDSITEYSAVIYHDLSSTGPYNLQGYLDSIADVYFGRCFNRPLFESPREVFKFSVGNLRIEAEAHKSSNVFHLGYQTILQYPQDIRLSDNKVQTCHLIYNTRHRLFKCGSYLRHRWGVRQYYLRTDDSIDIHEDNFPLSNFKNTIRNITNKLISDNFFTGDLFFGRKRMLRLTKMNLGCPDRLGLNHVRIDGLISTKPLEKLGSIFYDGLSYYEAETCKNVTLEMYMIKGHDFKGEHADFNVHFKDLQDARTYVQEQTHKYESEQSCYYGHCASKTIFKNYDRKNETENIVEFYCREEVEAFYFKNVEVLIRHKHRYEGVEIRYAHLILFADGTIVDTDGSYHKIVGISFDNIYF